MATPELQIPEGWKDRAPDGWDWQPLWEAVERGHHEFTHDFVTNAIEISRCIRSREDCTLRTRS